MKTHVKKTKFSYPALLISSCCGLVVISSGCAHPTITSAAEWIERARRRASDRPGAVTPHEQVEIHREATMPRKVRQGRKGVAPAMPTMDDLEQPSFLLASEAPKSGPRSGTIEEVSTEGGAK